MDWIGFLVGGAGIGSIITAVLTRMSSKETNKSDNNVKLWDRTYKLIETQEKQITSLETTVKQLRKQLDAEENENEELRKTIWQLENTINQMKQQLEQAKLKGR
ncbi:hypothetical protein [Jeotgalibaca porci]|uniref:hypothetical protein n=1 Tax=Jeotgalibaca porci TaxID=1868793 RepID=UPI00359FA4E0